MMRSLEQHAWYEAVVFVRNYLTWTSHDRTEPWIESSQLASDVLGLLTAYGYLEGSGSRIRPSLNAYDAEFADRMLPRIRTILDENGVPHGSFVSGSDLAPLVSEGWLRRDDTGYMVTPHGRAAIERIIRCTAS